MNPTRSCFCRPILSHASARLIGAASWRSSAIIFQRTGDERAWKDDIPAMRDPVKRVTKEELEHGDRQPPSVLVMETFVPRDPMKSHEVPRITDCIPSYSGLSRMRGTFFLARMECDVRLL